MGVFHIIVLVGRILGKRSETCWAIDMQDLRGLAMNIKCRM